VAAGFDHKQYLAALPKRPGVYRMYGADQELLYVGKARSLKDRVSHYFAASNVDPKVQALVAQIATIQVTVTNSDTERCCWNITSSRHTSRTSTSSSRTTRLSLHPAVRRPSFPAARLLPRRPQRRRALLRSLSTPGGARHPQSAAEAFRIRNCRDTFTPTAAGRACSADRPLLGRA
jgi:excinuclease ABC subunit C